MFIGTSYCHYFICLPQQRQEATALFRFLRAAAKRLRPIARQKLPTMRAVSGVILAGWGMAIILARNEV